jgi:hypothetical protein
MGYTNPQPVDGAVLPVPISSEYSPQNNTFPAMQGADGAYVDAYGNASTAPVMSFIQPRVVQRGIAQTGAGALSLSFTFKAPNMGGNSIVVCLGVGDMEDVKTNFVVTDTQGNTYTKVASQAQGATLESAIYLATGIKSGLGSNPDSLPLTNPVLNTPMVTIIGTAVVPTGISMKVYEVWGTIASVDALDQVDVGNGISGVASTTPITPTVSNTIAFTALAVANVTTISPSTGWSTNDGTLFPWGGNLGAFDSQVRQLSTIATVTPQAALSLSSAWAMCSATFRTIVLPVEGTFNYAPATNASMTSIVPSLNPIQFLAVNNVRKGVSVFNASSPLSALPATIFIAYGSVTAKTAYVTQIPPGALWEMPLPIVSLAIYGWWSNVDGSAKVTEIS